MAKDKNKVAPADGALVKQGSAKRRNRKAWPGDEAAEDKSPKSGKRRDSKKKKKKGQKEETKEETSSPQRGKQFKAPTQKRQSGLNGAADAVKASLAAVGGPSDKYAMAAEESYEDRQKRLKEAERKRRAEKRSKRFKKLWQMFGVPETIKLETVAAREAVNALNLTQKDLRHLKREFDEIDVDQSGLLLCGFTPSTRVGAVAAMPSSRDRATQAPWTPSNFLICSMKNEHRSRTSSSH